MKDDGKEKSKGGVTEGRKVGEEGERRERKARRKI